MLNLSFALFLFFLVQPTPASANSFPPVQDLFNKRCVVCHSCNNAPCQLDLGSAEGLLRGASKSIVYDGERLTPQSPSRLFIDAHTPKNGKTTSTSHL